MPAAREQRAVEYDLRQERVDDPEARGDEDRKADERDPPTVRAEKAGDAADEPAPRRLRFSWVDQGRRLVE
jgi:hypothetical protein